MVRERHSSVCIPWRACIHGCARARQAVLPKVLSIANFAGASLLSVPRLPASTSWLWFDTRELGLQDSGFTTVGVIASYPATNDSLLQPGAYVVNATVSLWREVMRDEVPECFTSSELVALLNLSDPRLLLPEALYALVLAKPIEIRVTAVVGAPFAAHCTARLLSPNVTTADATVYIDVTMRDVGGFLVQFSDDAMAMLAVFATRPSPTRSLALSASGGARRLGDDVASLQGLVAGAGNASFVLSFRPRIIGTLTFTVRVANAFVQFLNVSVLPVNCPAANTVVDPSGLACTCVSGSYFTDEGACVWCPPGTFKPEASHGGRPTYVLPCTCSSSKYTFPLFLVIVMSVYCADVGCACKTDSAPAAKQT